MPSTGKKSQGKNTCSKISKFDMYGRPVSLTFHGSEKFRTPVGAILTIILVVILAMFSAANLAKLNKLNPSFPIEVYEDSFYQEYKPGAEQTEVLTPGKVFAMGLGTTAVDASIGRFVVTQHFTNALEPALNTL